MISPPPERLTEMGETVALDEALAPAAAATDLSL
jgi:hypothetical protein